MPHIPLDVILKICASLQVDTNSNDRLSDAQREDRRVCVQTLKSCTLVNSEWNVGAKKAFHTSTCYCLRDLKDSISLRETTQEKLSQIINLKLGPSLACRYAAKPNVTTSLKHMTSLVTLTLDLDCRCEEPGIVPSFQAVLIRKAWINLVPKADSMYGSPPLTGCATYMLDPMPNLEYVSIGSHSKGWPSQSTCHDFDISKGGDSLSAKPLIRGRVMKTRRTSCLTLSRLAALRSYKTWSSTALTF